ncbi:MAG TPA: cytochrome c3 family protein [Vicinamibacterales bacterium]|nr:cytochrome c3 family protein [Vicinamibacterales bacterium]
MLRIAGRAATVLGSIVALAVLTIAAPAAAQTDLCAGCHQTAPGAPDSEHVERWQHSPHGRNGVGCEKCHGGNPGTADMLRAHQGVVGSDQPSSPTNRRHLAATCGACHSGPFVAFQKSRHYALLQTAERAEAPTCSTCHGSVAAQLLSPDALRRTCAHCHAAGRPAGHPEYPVQAAAMLSGIASVRTLLNAEQRAIRRIRSRDARASLEETYRQAEVPLIEAINEAHRFVFNQSTERLGVALRRAVALREQLGLQP